LITFDKYGNAIDDNNKIIVYSSNVLSMLIPEGGWSTKGDKYEDIEWISCDPISEEDFLNGFSIYESWKIQKDQEIEDKKAAAITKLEALGLTSEDIKALFS
jgi:hypothetical protein